MPATCFPTASALASSWNSELFRTIGEALGREAKKLGVSVVLGPGINMKRSPLCGRNFEYLSEDPWLAGELAISMVQGTQSQGLAPRRSTMPPTIKRMIDFGSVPRSMRGVSARSICRRSSGS